jgi:hypothetical protein
MISCPCRCGCNFPHKSVILYTVLYIYKPVRTPVHNAFIYLSQQNNLSRVNICVIVTRLIQNQIQWRYTHMYFINPSHSLRATGREAIHLTPHMTNIQWIANIIQFKNHNFVPITIKFKISKIMNKFIIYIYFFDSSSVLILHNYLKTFINRVKRFIHQKFCQSCCKLLVICY